MSTTMMKVTPALESVLAELADQRERQWAAERELLARRDALRQRIAEADAAAAQQGQLDRQIETARRRFDALAEEHRQAVLGLEAQRQALDPTVALRVEAEQELRRTGGEAKLRAAEAA